MSKLTTEDIVDLLPEVLQNKTWVTERGDISTKSMCQFILNLWYGRVPNQGISPWRSDRKFDRLVALAKKHHIAFFDHPMVGYSRMDKTKGKCWQLHDEVEEELRELEGR